VKDGNSCTILCDCGCCNGFHFLYYDGLIYASALTSYFGINQTVIWNKLKEKFRLAFGKDKWLVDTIIKKEDVERLIFWLKSHPCKNEKVKNYSHFHIEKDPEYSLSIKSDMPAYLVLLGKEYRCGEIVINEKIRKRLITEILRKIF